MWVRIIFVIVALMLVGCTYQYPGNRNSFRRRTPCPKDAGVITGMITDKDTGEPVIGASISLVGTRRGAQSDLEGIYIIKCVPPGAHALRMFSVQHKTAERTGLVVGPNSTSEVNQALVKKIVELDDVLGNPGPATREEIMVGVAHGPLELLKPMSDADRAQLSEKTGVIRGVVTDSGTGEPVNGVSVFVKDTRFGGITNENGEYLIHGLPPSTYLLRLTAIGYKPTDIPDVVVKVKDTVVVNAVIAEQPKELGPTPVDIKRIADTSKQNQTPLYASPEWDMPPVSGVQTTADGKVFIREGRAGEIHYIVDGMPFPSDPIGGSGPDNGPGKFGSIVGTVTDSLTGNPIQGAKVGMCYSPG